ncbi:hypothetical protein POSPLADRAFT_1146224 [Postia placenta MAD-698-R-SB12]|uniref:Cytochrome P450 n=1 Tax=Postia placenta MAD-698-R-SB12 TaxID=670580 RepID=A0A1X6MX70_9APHY|nr:hypothetical protein POSPLADRAFT_1146224 [Postia placenta MAD-698-R-SB12]OSX60947.1 hypothetical protein POSPLADRAFT_1146224 [Postia placenta MAD-698-R-SB12]
MLTFDEALNFSTILSALACLSAGVITLLLLLPYFIDQLQLREYPGALLAKFTSGWISWIISRNQWSETVDRLHVQHGSFVRLAPNHVSVSGPSAFEAIYGHPSSAAKAPFYDIFSAGGAANIFTTRDRAEHARKRRVEAHMFSPQSIRTLESTVSVHFHALVDQWDALCAHIQKAGSGGAEGIIGSVSWKVHESRVWFDCMPWFMFWSFDSIADLSFGRPFGMLVSAKDVVRIPKSNASGIQAIAEAASHSKKTELEMVEVPLIEVLVKRGKTIAALAYLPAWAQPIIGRLPGFREGYGAIPKLNGIAIAAVADRLRSPNGRADMLTKLLEGRDGEGYRYGPQELSAEAKTLIAAGGDTTARSASVLPLDAALDGTGSEIAPYGAVKVLPYLEAVVNEGLRLHSGVGAGLPRVVPAGGMTILGHHLMEGTVVSSPIYTLHRSKAVWGANADEFYPERWIDASADTKKEMMSSFAPFSIGLRACIGRNLAMQQLQIVTATIFRRYSIVLQDDAPLEIQDSFGRKPKKCIIGVKRRDLKVL